MNPRVEGGAPRRPLIQEARRSSPLQKLTAPRLVIGRRRMSFLTTFRTGGREGRDMRSAIP